MTGLMRLPGQLALFSLASYVAHWDESRVFKCLIVRSLIYSFNKILLNVCSVF